MRWRDRPKSVKHLMETDNSDDVVQMLLDWVPSGGVTGMEMYYSVEKEKVTEQDRKIINNYYDKVTEEKQIWDELDDF